MAIVIVLFTIALIGYGLAVNYYSSLMWLTLTFLTILVFFFLDTVRVWLITYCFTKVNYGAFHTGSVFNKHLIYR